MHGSEVVLLLIVHENLGSIPRTPKCLASRRERGNGIKSVTVAGVLVLGGGVTRCWGASWLMLGELTFPRSAGRQTRGSCHQPGGSEQGDGDSPLDASWMG